MCAMRSGEVSCEIIFFDELVALWALACDGFVFGLALGFYTVCAICTFVKCT